MRATTRRRPTCLAVLLAVTLFGGCTVETGSDPDVATGPSDIDIADAVLVAEQLCPVIQDWADDVAGIMNGLSQFGISESDPAVRNTHYLERMVELTERNAEYDRAVAGLPSGPIMDELVRQIRAGLVRGAAQIEDMSASVTERTELDLERPQIRISGLFSAAEKVLSFGKPRLGRMTDATAARAGFRQVAVCQRNVMDIPQRSQQVEAVGGD